MRENFRLPKMIENSASDFTVCLMTEEEVEGVKQLEVESGLGSWTLNDYKKEVYRDDSVCLVVKSRKHELVGFGVSRFVVGVKKELMTVEDGNFAEIYNVCVSKNYRKKGIGWHLLCEMICHFKLKEVRTIWLDVRESNLSAIRFYERNGFKKDYTRKLFYSKPSENSIVMKLLLPSGN